MRKAAGYCWFLAFSLAFCGCSRKDDRGSTEVGGPGSAGATGTASSATSGGNGNPGIAGAVSSAAGSLGKAGAGGGTGDIDAEIAWIGQELLGRPTAHSITVKALAAQAIESYFEYGTSSGSYSMATAPRAFSDGAIETVLEGLSSNARYYYRIRYRPVGSTGAFAAGEEHTFPTQRAPTETFAFAVQSDSHLGNSSFNHPLLYSTTMENIAKEQPDFVFDLGDAVDLYEDVETASTVGAKYLDQRAYFAIPGHSSAVFLVIGNHEREEGWNLDDFGSDVEASLPVLSANARKRYFANPVPDAFYSGNPDQLEAIDGDHLRGDYYAFEWGDALFVAIDPYWYTMTKPYSGSPAGERDDEVVGSRWDWTLGEQQYRWLKETLENSSARFKFVFSHQEVGGIYDYGRGGALGARFCEWGGDDPDSTAYSFDTNRPGWGEPIHQLFVRTQVTAFFHGHDHLYAKEVLDGVVYQEVPMAANANYNLGVDSENGYPSYYEGDMIANSGHLLVTVAPTGVTVEYVRSYLPGHGENGEVAAAYTL